MSAKNTISRSQIISPFGVGAIFESGGESLVQQDINYWPDDNREYFKIELPRLQTALGKSHFRLPPVPIDFKDSHNRILFKRFPTWHFCPRKECRRMYQLRWQDEITGKLPQCKACKDSVLAPMRFITICEKGYMGDVDWWLWAHFGSSHNSCQDRDNLKLISAPNRGAGLGSLSVRCESCPAENTLEGISSANSMQKLKVKCSGTQPWMPRESRQECDCTPQVVQRGASNVCFPKIHSALDIFSRVSVESEDQNIKNIITHPKFADLKEIYESEEGEMTKGLVNLTNRFAAKLQCPAELIISLLKGERNETPEASREESAALILPDEWKAFLNPDPDQKKDDNFFTEPLDRNDYKGENQEVLSPFSNIILVHRLREVRALEGFERYKTTGEHVVKSDLDKGKDWLPAVEVFGEGIFLKFDDELISDWESNNQTFLSPRIDQATKQRNDNNLTFLPEPTARFILLHTFAHLLMRQICFECGYSSSSLRERIYSAQPGESHGPMAGILIYTADSDSEGSLGGLADQGRFDRLIPNIAASLINGEWCSNDPICGEIEGQGLAGLNRAACHACALVSETSCVYGNALLDRTLLLGEKTPGSAFEGFFEQIVKQISA